ncbi:hypothetical protein SAMN05428949_1082 [Chitinophaga sp. YR627]|uniref:hypothetical protein n=1 Tax=Chitinophaga sp. YR627 TaxID=1881041 RepID=UPI0008E386DE|nr:hypothetical protein [Chitinophaga sp. YR627]SFM86180.1 hypothetical protein SAMN05428949_1082 [Chitinophaga sp. YR627]
MENLTIWKKITLGEAWGVQQLAASLKAHKHMIDPSPWHIMHTPEFSTGHISSEIALIRTTLRALGLEDGVSYADIFAAAEKAGLALCPPELGPRLRLAYDQPYEETLVIAMTPIKDEDNLPSVFTVHHWDWGQGLGACCCGKSDIEDDWHADSEWVFRLK